MRWYRQAADDGLAEAQDNVGLLYENGLDVPKDNTEAARWYRKAADQGFAPAQYNLGVLYESGARVPKDDVEARYWYGLAATQGYEEAKKALARLSDNPTLPDAEGTSVEQSGEAKPSESSTLPSY